MHSVPVPAASPVWPEPVSTFGSFAVTTFIREFTCVSRAVRPWPPTRLGAGRTAFTSRLRRGSFRPRGTLSECFTRFVTSSRFLVGYGWWDSRSCTDGGQDTQSSDFTSHEAVGVEVAVGAGSPHGAVPGPAAGEGRRLTVRPSTTKDKGGPDRIPGCRARLARMRQRGV